MQVRVSAQKSILDHVVGMRLVAGEPIGHLEQTVAVTLNDPAEGVGITGTRLFDQVKIVFLHPNH
jgi:hypothetical protein